MTEKQEQILKAALLLFAREGFNATSTSKVARAAKVSEGLIFKHFGNKEGLLTAVLDLGKHRAQDLFLAIISEPIPQSRIEQAIALPFLIPESDYEFWRLQFKLKWELGYTDPNKLRPLQDALTRAFEALHAAEPILETNQILVQMDGLSASLLRNEIPNKEAMKLFLIQKFRQAFHLTELNQ